MKPRFIFAAALSILLTGCGTTAKFVYPNKMNSMVEVASAPVYKQKVAVVLFDDGRDAENQMATTFIYLIPLCPFGWVNYQRPDAARGFMSIEEFQFTPSEDLAKAAALSLRHSNLFADAFFTFGGEKNNADLVFEGKIISTDYTGRVFSYGLSVVGPLLWVVGAPAGTSLNRLTLAFTLKNKANKIIWEYSFDRDDYIVQWLYYRMGRDVTMYSILMQQAMNDAIADLTAKLRANPQILK